MKNSNEHNNTKPSSLMDSSSLPLAPSSFHVWKKPYFMNHGDSGASSSGTKPYHPPLPPSDLLPTVNDDINKTTCNQQRNPSPSPPSDEHKKTIPTGDDIHCWTREADRELDPGKLRRIMSNRESAKKCRMKKHQYVSEMEKEAKSLEARIAVLGSQVSLFRDHKEFLRTEQKSLNQRLTTYNNNIMVINAEIEANKVKVAKLRKIHLSQQKQKMQQQQQQQNRLPPPVCESAGSGELLLNSSSRSTPGPGANRNQVGNENKPRLLQFI